LNFKGHKMKQTPLTNMEGRYITPATKEAFDALVKMGYKFDDDKGQDASYLTLDGRYIIWNYFINTLLFKQAYYHNGNFYDQPYEEEFDDSIFDDTGNFDIMDVIDEEFTINEEKVPFPDTFEFFASYLLDHCEGETITYENLQSWLSKSEKERKRRNEESKIDRRLHENRPLALAIGKMLDESRTACIDVADGTFLQYVSSTGEYFMVYSGAGTNVELYDVSACTLPDDYTIPDQVLQWMKEYQKQVIK